MDSQGSLFQSRRVSILILGGIVVAIGLVFYRVIQPFLFSLLFACVVGVLFRPVFTWVERVLKGRRRIAAGLTTLAILLMVVVPLLTATALTAWQLFDVASDLVVWANPKNETGLSDRWKDFRETQVYEWGNEQWENLSDDQRSQAKSALSKGAGVVANTAAQTTQAIVANAIGFVLGFTIMMLALYYFYADGPRLLAVARRFSPLNDVDELALIQRFEKVCRGVVLGTVVSAFVQAVLAAIGFTLVGMDSVLVLAAFTMFFAFIPFLGAGIVWFSVSVYLAANQQYFAASFIFLYGAIIVSLSDNVIKAFVIGGEAKLHPLIVLITVLGAIKLLGILGIFIGPMVAAFLYAFLDILRRQLLDRPQEEEATSPALGLAPGSVESPLGPQLPE